MSKEAKTKEAEVVEVPEVNQAPSLTLQDLTAIKNIIDVASQRGVFKTEEFTMVGQTYAKLAEFIAAITPPAPAEATQDAEAVAE